MRTSGLRLGLLLLLAAGCADAPGPGPLPTAPHVVIRVGPVPASVRVVTTHAARRRGLQGVSALGSEEGMLFVYRHAGTRSIWMQDTLIPLDVAFLDARGHVLQLETLHPPAGPGSEPERARSRVPAQYVLEMPAGFFTGHGLGVGTAVVLPGSIDVSRADP